MFADLYQFPAVSFRFFNVYGPRQSSSSPYSGVIAKFCTTLLAGQAPTVFGDGLQSRDFIFVSDVVRSLISAAELPIESVAGQSFNLGTGQSVTLLDLINLLNHLLDTNIPPNFHPPRTGDIKISKADITKAIEKLQFKPRISLKEGLSQTLDFYRKNNSQ